MSLGLGQLRLPPDIFWRLTLPELAAAARALRPAHAVPIRQADFAALVARYPD
jgi:uncharacterized phage protein (TIGR02216 family)